jgi:hypothetical protein
LADLISLKSASNVGKILADLVSGIYVPKNSFKLCISTFGMGISIRKYDPASHLGGGNTVRCL